MGHKYLEELDNYLGPYCGLKNDTREPQWIEEKEIYGFDSTETWSLDTSFFLWLYEHLRMYMEQASVIVNLHYHQFEFNGKTYYQDELIDEMLKRIRFYFSDDYDDWDEKDCAYVSDVAKIWAIVLPAMWW